MKLVELVTRHAEVILTKLGELPAGGPRETAGAKALQELAHSLESDSLTVPTSVIVASRLLEGFASSEAANKAGALVRAILLAAEDKDVSLSPGEACLLAELTVAPAAPARPRVARPRAVAAVDPPPPPSPRATPRGPLQGIEVLVVDDESDARELAAMVLAQAGANVREADCASGALEEVQTSPPDVIVSDIGMPGQDGHSLIRTIRRLPRPAGGVRAMALTAFARSEDRHRSLDAGFDMHLVKPIEPLSLVAAVSKLAGRDPTATAL